MHSGLTNREALSDAVPYSAAQQPARQRLVAVGPRPVPVVGLPHTRNQVAERIGERGGRVGSRRATCCCQVAAQVPVLVLSARVAHLLIHRTTVAVVYPLERVADVRGVAGYGLPNPVKLAAIGWDNQCRPASTPFS